MKRIQIFRLTLVCALALGVLAGLHLLTAGVSAEPAGSTSRSLAATQYITVTTPTPGAVLTQTPQLIKMNYYRAESIELGSLLLNAVSVTITGEEGPYYLATWVTTTETGVVYSYTWELPDEDYTPYTISARALDIFGVVETSEPVIVYVDTQSPTVVLTLPTYVDNVPFTISWQVMDGSEQVTYTLDYQRVDETVWARWLPATGWLTQTGEMSEVFTKTIDSGYTYRFRLYACDEAGHCGEKIENIRVGKYRLYLPLTLRAYPPVWKRGAGSAGVALRAPIGCGESTWYAGTNTDGVWRSTNNAQNWSRIANLQPEAYPIAPNSANCTQAFVAVWGGGVYRLDGAQSNLVTGDLIEPFVYGLVLKENGVLYAGTNSQGIYTTTIGSVNWQPANAGIGNLSIRSLFNIDGTLYAGARACTFYSSIDNGETWVDHVVLSNGCNNAQVWSVTNVKGALYAGLGLNEGLHDNATGTWEQVDAIPTTTIWGLAYDGQNALYVSAYGAGVYRCKVDGDGVIQGCGSAALGLGTQNTRELYIRNNLLVAGSDDGVWYLPLIP